MGCLYKIDFDNGKSYIGISSTTATDRWRRHSRQKKPTTLIGRAFAKYGEGCAKMSVLVIANDWDYLCLLEQKAISAFKTKFPDGLNLTGGGEGMIGHVWSEEARAKVSRFHKGRKKSETELANMSAAQKGLKKNWTESWKQNVKNALRGKSWCRGVKRSEETKAKQSTKKAEWWAGLSKQEREDFCKKRADAQKEKKRDNS